MRLFLCCCAINVFETDFSCRISSANSTVFEQFCSKNTTKPFISNIFSFGMEIRCLIDFWDFLKPLFANAQCEKKNQTIVSNRFFHMACKIVFVWEFFWPLFEPVEIGTIPKKSGQKKFPYKKYFANHMKKKL